MKSLLKYIQQTHRNPKKEFIRWWDPSIFHFPFLHSAPFKWLTKDLSTESDSFCIFGSFRPFSFFIFSRYRGILDPISSKYKMISTSQLLHEAVLNFHSLSHQQWILGDNFLISSSYRKVADERCLLQHSTVNLRDRDKLTFLVADPAMSCPQCCPQRCWVCNFSIFASENNQCFSILSYTYTDSAKMLKNINRHLLTRPLDCINIAAENGSNTI